MDINISLFWEKLVNAMQPEGSIGELFMEVWADCETGGAEYIYHALANKVPILYDDTKPDSFLSRNEIMNARMQAIINEVICEPNDVDMDGLAIQLNHKMRLLAEEGKGDLNLFSDYLFISQCVDWCVPIEYLTAMVCYLSLGDTVKAEVILQAYKDNPAFEAATERYKEQKGRERPKQ
jgi:hypothetical protein